MKRGFRYILKFLLILVTPVIIYLFLAFIGSVIPVNADADLENGEIDIFLLRQDMHTDILVPVKSEMVTWDTIFKPEHTLAQSKNSEYIGFGWGDLDFYRNTPQWEDLKFSIAFNALFVKTQSALHTRYYRNIPTSGKLVRISVSEDHYKKLSEYILNTVNAKKQEIQPVTDLNYNRDDAFYPAQTSFHLFKNCNTWTNSALKASGLKACLWTPFPQGIFYQYN